MVHYFIPSSAEQILFISCQSLRFLTKVISTTVNTTINPIIFSEPLPLILSTKDRKSVDCSVSK